MAKGLGLSNGLVQWQPRFESDEHGRGSNAHWPLHPWWKQTRCGAFRLLVARCGTPVLQVIPITAYHKKNTIRFNMPICREITSWFRRFLDCEPMWTIWTIIWPCGQSWALQGLRSSHVLVFRNPSRDVHGKQLGSISAIGTEGLASHYVMLMWTCPRGVIRWRCPSLSLCATVEAEEMSTSVLNMLNSS